MAEFGELVLVLGDLHIPHRAAAIPEKFNCMLVPNKMQHVLCTGNLVSHEQLEELKALAPNVHVVRGDMDEACPSSLPASAPFPDTKVVTIGELRLGLCHGHQVLPWGEAAALDGLARELDVDVLITGHTHKQQVSERGGALVPEPGQHLGSILEPGGGGGGGGERRCPASFCWQCRGPRSCATCTRRRSRVPWT
ncbi:vacuolar protein sorting-associated protein 29 [Nannochloropsis gaditana]|uniref:Vacuolar protein sorting-associated protein 29 n=1 Tax=Nannochloropsis gaditana TaxID=72520 RepID=W7T9Y5_9STRA|nr:vacuolar protein sorting-associated protein 29 [Nannochloropsis gaditana]